MKRILLSFALALAAVSAFALPKVHIIATGGTIAGTASGNGYTAGQVTIQDILDAVPGLAEKADLDYEQFCNIGSQNMDETIWLKLAKRVNEVQNSGKYDAIIITHGSDTMEETAFFLNLTTHNEKPIVLVGSMRPSNSPEADGPGNLMVALETAISPDSIGKEVMCCMDKTIYYAGSVFKSDSHAIDAFDDVKPDFVTPHNNNTGFDIDDLVELPKVGIIYGYGGCSTLPLQAFIDAEYDGVVLAGVGGGNFYQPVQDLAVQAVKKGMKVVRATRCPFGGVYTNGGEVDDYALGFIASGILNPQKARILLMLALTRTTNTNYLRYYFSHAVTNDSPVSMATEKDDN